MCRVLITAALCLVLGTAPSLAQDFTVDGDLIKVTSLGHVVSLPVPQWARTDGEPDEALLQLVRNPFAADVETLEFIPAGESIESWTRMIAAMVVARPGYPAAAHEDSIVTAFNQGCDQAALDMGIAATAEGDLPPVFLVACGVYASGGLPATAAGAGEIFIGSIVETGNGAVKLYQEWRGAAFSPDDVASWPVTGEELGAAIKAFHSEGTAEVE